MTKQVETYKQLILDFCNEMKIYKNKIDDIPGLFLPHGLNNYDKAERKYFYVGRDTNEWFSFNGLLADFEDNNIERYIDANNGWPKTVSDVLKYANNKSGGFWTLAGKLHLRLNGISEDISINDDIDKNYKDILEEMGYGNLNSIETDQSLKNRGVWNCIDQSIYWDIKSKSRIFDKLKFIIDIYKPDCIFIFNWVADEELALSDIDVERIEDEYIDGICSTFNIKGSNTKIIWTIHPRNLSYKGMNIDELIAIICERVKK